MLAWYKRTYKGTPYLFSAGSFPFWGEIKQPSLVLLNICFSTAAKTLAPHHKFKIASLLSHSSRAAAHLGITSLEIQNKVQIFRPFSIPFQDLQSPSGKLPVRNVTTQSAFLNILSSARVSLPLESRRLEVLNLVALVLLRKENGDAENRLGVSLYVRSYHANICFECKSTNALQVWYVWNINTKLYSTELYRVPINPKLYSPDTKFSEINAKSFRHPSLTIRHPKVSRVDTKSSKNFQSLPKISEVDLKTSEVFRRFPKFFENLRRWPEDFGRFPKVVRSLPKIHEVNRKTSEDFRNRPEDFRRCPRFNQRLSKISDVGTRFLK